MQSVRMLFSLASYLLRDTYHWDAPYIGALGFAIFSTAFLSALLCRLLGLRLMLMATAGGVVFGGTADRRLFAVDAETGDLLWETRLNGDISGAPVTFEVDGRQYLAVGAGGRIAQTTSFARFTDTNIPQGSGVMWVFALPE